MVTFLTNGIGSMFRLPQQISSVVVFHSISMNPCQAQPQFDKTRNKKDTTQILEMTSSNVTHRYTMLCQDSL